MVSIRVSKTRSEGSSPSGPAKFEFGFGILNKYNK